MVTRKTVVVGSTIDDDALWQAVARYVFPAGIPRDPGEVGNPFYDSKFSVGYPDRYVDPWIVEWDHDFSPAEEAEWDRVLREAKRRTEPTRVADTDPYVAELRIWKRDVVDAGVDPTVEQITRVITAMMHLWRLDLRDDV
jgi:hypothetical protein